MPDRQDAGQAEANEREGTVPSVSAAIRRQHHLRLSASERTCVRVAKLTHAAPSPAEEMRTSLSAMIPERQQKSAQRTHVESLQPRRIVESVVHPR